MADHAESIKDYFLNQMKDAGLYCSQSLSDMDIPVELLNSIPKELVVLYHILPIQQENEAIVLVTDTEQTFKQRAQLEQQLAHKKVKLLLGSEDNLRLSLLKFYGIQNYRQNTIKQRNVNEDMTPLKGMINTMLQDAARDHASDIHILPTSQHLRITFRINGHMYDVSADYNFPISQTSNIFSLIKQMDKSGNTDFTRTNMPNEGSFLLTHGNETIFIRLETLPIGGAEGLEKINLRLLPQATHGSARKTLDDIGYVEEDLQAIKCVLYKNATGLFINSGPTGAGKTTSLYAQIHFVLDTIGEPLNVITIDDPIEIRDEDFAQVQVRKAENESLSLTPEKILEASLRSDPDILLDNEIRNAKDARVAMQSSNTGHRVFSTVHAGDCIKTISRLLDFDISKTTLLAELKLIISQRLVAKLCPHCSRPHILTPPEISILSPDELTRLKAADLRELGTLDEIRQCKYCNYGIIGRTAIAEYVEFNMEIRDALLQQRSFSQIENILRKYNFRNMWEKGLNLVECGEIELDELIHIVGKE